MLELMRTEFEGEVAGLMADLTNMPQILIDFLIKEAGENPNDAIAFLNKTADQLSKFEDKGKDEGENHNTLPPDPGDKSNIASKTQGTLPKINKLLNKLSQFLLCTKRIDKSFFDCRGIHHSKVATGRRGHVTGVSVSPFGNNPAGQLSG